MKLRKLDWWEMPSPKRKPLVVAPRGLQGPAGRDGETRIVREVIEKPVDVAALLEPITKEIDKLKRKRPEFVGGSGATGTYHKVETAEMYFTASSFNPGINIIGVASGVPTTIWLPSRLDQNHLIAIKDELGIAAAQPITVRVRTT